MRRFFRSELLTSLGIITAVMLLTYLPLVPQLGYYREDWYILWNGLRGGASSFIALFSNDRPFSGFIYAAIYPVLRDSIFAWHIYALLLRYLGVITLFFILRKIWPGWRKETTLAALLFAIYPGFLQQPQANSFQIHLTGIFLALLSIACMVFGVFSMRKWLASAWNSAAFLLALIYPFTMEYYIGIEGLRAVLLWSALSQKENLPLQKTIFRWIRNMSPYLLATALFLVWRIGFFESDRPAVDIDRLTAQYATGYGYYVLRFLIELPKDVVEALFLSWIVPFSDWLYYGTYPENLIGILIAGSTASICGMYFFHSKNDSSQGNTGSHRDLQKFWLWIGLIAVISSLVPIIAANQDARFFGREDRFLLPAAMGAAIFFAGCLIAIPKVMVRNILCVVLIGISVFTHFQHTLYMRDSWNVERQLWWQLSWRAPQLKRNTLLVVNLPDRFDFAEDYEAWAPANILYAPHEQQPFITAEIPYTKLIYQLQEETKAPYSYRGIFINRHFENTLVLSMPDLNSCLHTLDGNKIELSTLEEPLIRTIASFSHGDRVLINAPFIKPNSAIFGTEPPHTWCYYFQKASYYRQAGNWGEIVRLGDEAQAKNLSPQDLVEWMPFYEAYVNTDQASRALEIASAMRSQYGLANSLCQHLNIESIFYPGEYDLEQVREWLCTP